MARRGRPRNTPLPPPDPQENQFKASSAPHQHIPPPDQQAHQMALQQALPPVQQVQSAASVHVQQRPPPSPLAPAAPNIPAPAGAPAAAIPMAGLHPTVLAQMMQGFFQAQQLQTILLQTILAREQAPAAPPAQHLEPKVGTLRDFNSFNPPVFYGHEEPEDADAWLRMTHKLLVASHIPEADMVNAAQTKMDKMAGAWIASEMALRGEVMSWDDFKKLFQQKFIPPSSQRRMVKRFLELTQGSRDVSLYTHEFEILRKYATRVLPDEDSRVEWYINGLSSQLKALVRACKPTTLLEAQQSALQMEQDAGEAKGNKFAFQKRPASQFLKGGPQTLVKSARTSFQARPVVSAASVTQRARPPITCLGCGKKGHKIADCWWTLGKCLRCGAADHKIGECPEAGGRGVQSATASQPAPSAAKGKAQLLPVGRPALGIGRGSAPISAQTQTPVQGGAPLPTQSPVYRQFGRAQGRDKRGLYTMASESEPASEIITVSVRKGA